MQGGRELMPPLLARRKQPAFAPQKPVCNTPIALHIPKTLTEVLIMRVHALERLLPPFLSSSGLLQSQAGCCAGSWRAPHLSHASVQVCNNRPVDAHPAAPPPAPPGGRAPARPGPAPQSPAARAAPQRAARPAAPPSAAGSL